MKLFPVLLVLLLSALIGCQDKTVLPIPAEVRGTVVEQLKAAGVNAKGIDQAKGLFKAVNLKGQGAVAWLVDFSALPSGLLCGTGGCPLQVWVKSGASPYTLAFDRQVLGHALEHQDPGQHGLSVELHGVFCGGTGSDSCRYHFEWRGKVDSPGGYFIATSFGGKPSRYKGPLVQALPVREPQGGAVAKVLVAYRAACAAAGGKVELEAALQFLPDLNGDGQRELLFDADAAYCEHEGAPVAMNCSGDICKSRLFTEKDGQGWRAAWTGEPFAYAVDLSQSEPRLIIRPADCGAPSPERCTERALVWQNAAQKFFSKPVSIPVSLSPVMSNK